MTIPNPFKTDAVADKLALARAMCVKKAPYFSSVVYGFVYRPIASVETMTCTPNMILGYNPDWVMGSGVDELAADIAHMVHHFKRAHHERSLEFADKDKFNFASCLSINPDLKAGGWQLSVGPKGAIMPKPLGLPEGKAAEEYYRLLPDGQVGSGVGAGQCGGCGGGKDASELGGLEDGLGRSAAEMKGIEKVLGKDIADHIAKFGRGSVPNNLVEWTQIFEPEQKIRWQDELAHILRDAHGRTQAGGDDFSMRRPSKRSALRGFPRPGLVEYQSEIAIIRDSSGSMSQDQLMVAVREAYNIIQSLGVEDVWFCDADTECSMPWKRVGADFFRNLTEVHGRGGTDFQPAIDSALALQPRPDLIVYLTDGDGSTGDAPPLGTSVVWGIVDGGYGYGGHPKWGHVVKIED
jgi:predicted metal-dependent peptidase